MAPVVKRAEKLFEKEESVLVQRDDQIVLGQNQRQLALHKLNIKKMRMDYQSFDEWHKVDQIFHARDELVRAEQAKIKYHVTKRGVKRIAHLDH